jgi:hypothetical protein
MVISPTIPNPRVNKIELSKRRAKILHTTSSVPVREKFQTVHEIVRLWLAIAVSHTYPSPCGNASLSKKVWTNPSEK